MTFKLSGEMDWVTCGIRLIFLGMLSQEVPHLSCFSGSASLLKPL